MSDFRARPGATRLLRAVLCLPFFAAQAHASECDSARGLDETVAEQVRRLMPLEGRCKHDVAFLYYLGQALNGLQEYALAVDPLESVLMQQPNHLPAKLEYAIALYGVGERVSADALLAELEHEDGVPSDIRAVLNQRRQRWRNVEPVPLLWHRSMALIGGYDDNLMGSTHTSRLDLTIPGGILPVALAENTRPREGGFVRLDWRQDARQYGGDGSYWNFAYTANVRHAPSHNETDFYLLGASVERVAPAQQGPFVLATAYRLDTPEGNVFGQLAMAAGLDAHLGPNGCQWRMGGEFIHRYYPKVTVFNGLYGGLIVQAHCVDWGWYGRLRLGSEFEEHGNRPGGDAQRAGLMVGKQFRRAAHRLNAEIDYEQVLDKEGFSPLLDNNARKRINKTIYRVEYSYSTKFVEPLLGIEYMSQHSNLALYNVRTRMAYAGLRWAW